jgi:hypothetical protein
MYRVADGKLERVYRNEAQAGTGSEVFTSCEFGPGERTILGGVVYNGQIRIFDSTTRKLIGTLAGNDVPNDVPVGDMVLVDDHRLLTGGADGVIRLWDLREKTVLRKFEGHNSGVQSIAVERSGARFISTGADLTIRFWNIEETTPLLTMVTIPIKPHSGFAAKEATVFVDRNGYFDFTDARGLEYVHMARGWDAIGLPQLADVFYRPGLVEAVRTGRAAAKEVDLNQAFHMPPEVQLAAEAGGHQIK